MRLVTADANGTALGMLANVLIELSREPVLILINADVAGRDSSIVA
jgi:hypothetical protein